MIGKARVEMKAGLMFACMNLKKLAKWLKSKKIAVKTMASLPPFCKVLIIVIGPKITEMDMLKAIILEKESVKVFL